MTRARLVAFVALAFAAALAACTTEVLVGPLHDRDARFPDVDAGPDSDASFDADDGDAAAPPDASSDGAAMASAPAAKSF